MTENERNAYLVVFDKDGEKKTQKCHTEVSTDELIKMFTHKDAAAIYLISEPSPKRCPMQQILVLGSSLIGLCPGTGKVYRYDPDINAWHPVSMDFIIERIL